MIEFTFYPEGPGRAPLPFVMFDLADDLAAIAHCEVVAAQHATCVLVNVWQGERFVGRQDC